MAKKHHERKQDSKWTKVAGGTGKAIAEPDVIGEEQIPDPDDVPGTAGSEEGMLVGEDYNYFLNMETKKELTKQDKERYILHVLHARGAKGGQAKKTKKNKR